MYLATEELSCEECGAGFQCWDQRYVHVMTRYSRRLLYGCNWLKLFLWLLAPFLEVPIAW